ncbi:MAG: insulinase family protein [Deltaproteobacteria bacterium]|nr:insulinase family protein [Deltaproteobacteria bacterium]
MKRLLPLLGLLACGPKPAPAPPTPTLPSDGTDHTAKPPPAPDAPAVVDAWQGHELIQQPAAKAPAAVQLPAIENFKLANGLDVFVVRDPKLPVVSMQLAIKAGRMDEPRARLGVSEAAADMLVKGTKKHDAVGLAKTIDFVGGTIGADATFEATLLSCSVLSKNVSTCMDLMPEMITQSTFPDAELAKVKDLMLGTVRQHLDDAGALASEQIQNLLWGNDHVRGWINSEQSIANLHRDDLVAWAKTWYVPNNSLLVVTGDVDAKKLKGDLERAFGTWAKGAVPPAPSYKEPGLSGSKIRLVDKPGQTQTHIRIAQFGIKHDDPRFFDTLVWNYALGGGAFSSRLMKVVRVEGGKTYGASSSFDRNLDRGSWVATTFTRNSEAVATAKLILKEIQKMAAEGPTQGEIDAAVANLAGSWGLRFQSAGDIGSALVGAELHGFGKEYLANYPLAVGKVDQASAKRAAQQILTPRDYVIVMVGDAKDLEPQLKKEGWRYEKVSAVEPVTPVEVAQQPVDPKAAAAAKPILADALAAKGGKAKLAAIKAIHETASGTTAIQDHDVPVDIDRMFVMPDKLRIDATLHLAKDVKIIETLTGGGGWMGAPNPQTFAVEISDLPAAQVASAQFEIWRDPELILLKASDAGAKVVAVADEALDGKPQSVLHMQSPFPGMDISLYIDKKTKLLTRIAYTESGQQVNDDFADYRDVNGIKVSFKRTSSSRGHATTLTLGKVEFDPKVDPALFSKPKDVK